MQKAYSRINWKNYPITDTPLNETNLNRMDSALNEVDNRVISLDGTKFNVESAKTLLKDVSVNNTTGVITLTAYDGTTKTLNTNLGKIAVNFTYDVATQRLILTDSDGTKIYIDLSELVQNNDFADTDTIDFTVTSGIVSAIVKNGSINENHLRPNYLADIRVSEAGARLSMETAEEYKDTTKGYMDTTKDYMDATSDLKDETDAIKTTTEGIKSQVDESVREIASMIGASSFTVNFETGNLEYTNESYYTFTINRNTGNLEWEVVE